MTVKLDPPEQGNSATESSIGAVLRTERLRLGYALADMAERLRIRPSYLQAIEDARYGDLPGATYALGFIRAYAEALGLDPAAIIQRFKQETAGGIDTRTQLVFPSPVSEGRVPGGAILFLGLILAGAAYGGWYYTSSRDISLTEMVPSLPENLRILLGEQPAGAGPITPAAPGEVVPPAEPEPAEAPAPETSAAPASADLPVSTETVVAEPEPAAAPAVPAAPPAAAPPSQPMTQAAAPAAATPVAMTVAGAPVIAPATVDTPAEPVVEAAVAAPPPAPAALPNAGSDARAYGQDNAGSRVVLKAIGDSWIEVRDGETMLLKRLMRKGDTYRVPDRSGVTLMTGSAGALEIMVDGRAIPSLGPIGAVRRDIALDPEKLIEHQ